MKTVIFGAKGMLGGALRKVFPNALALDRAELDLLNSAAVEAFFETEKPALVINAAAYNAVDACEEDEDQKQLAYRLNGELPGILATQCKNSGATFVHYSSDYVFAGDGSTPLTEDAVPRPISVYGESKLAGEHAVQSVGGQYYIIRLSRLFGKEGESDMSKRSFIDTMLYLVQEAGKTELSIVEDEVGSPTYAPDLAAFTKALVDGNHAFGVYHGANDGECSWFAFANEAFQLAKLTVQTTPCSASAYVRAAKRPPYSTLANTKMPKQRNWQDALAAYIL